VFGVALSRRMLSFANGLRLDFTTATTSWWVAFTAAASSWRIASLTAATTSWLVASLAVVTTSWRVAFVWLRIFFLHVSFSFASSES
jgi:hypothetical protein